MSGNVGKPELETQRRVIALFRDELDYRFLGNWTDRDGNSNIEQKLLTDYLHDTAGYSQAQINGALQKLTTEANNSNRGLYENNHAVYKLLRYGVPVKVEAGKPTDTIHLIAWDEPEKNDFAIVEEVTLEEATTIRVGYGNRETTKATANGTAATITTAIVTAAGGGV